MFNLLEKLHDYALETYYWLLHTMHLFDSVILGSLSNVLDNFAVHIFSHVYRICGGAHGSNTETQNDAELLMLDPPRLLRFSLFAHKYLGFIVLCC